VHFGKDGEIAIDGHLPISTMGGLKARGHPVGATGVYQLVESCQQLTDNAAPNQIRNAAARVDSSPDDAGADPLCGVTPGLRAIASSPRHLLFCARSIPKPEINLDETQHGPNFPLDG
jgi:hypothetical protein